MKASHKVELRASIARRLAEYAADNAGVCPVIRPQVVDMVYRHMSTGNRKLPRSTAIWNMCAASDCPAAALGLCPIPQGKCYALKAERAYPQVLPYRRTQADLMDVAHPLELVAAVAELQARFGVSHWRVSEAGDFRTQQDVDTIHAAALALRDTFGVVSYCYTARHDLDYGDIGHDHPALVVNSSGQRLNGGGGNTFHAVELPSDSDIICKGNCRVCSLCTKAHGKAVVVPLH